MAIVGLINRGTEPDTGGSDSLQNSAEKSPQALLEENPLKLDSYKYPLELGDDSVYKHLMRISIYRQNKTNYVESGLVAGNSYDFSLTAGDNKVKKLSTAEGANWAAVYGLAKAGSQIAADYYANKATGGLTNNSGAGSSAVNASAGALGAIVGGLAVDATTERSTQKQAAAFISLYMPETLVVTDRQDFDAVSFTEALGAAGTALGMTQELGERGGRIAEASGVFGKGIVDVALFSNGYALNPLLEVIYKGSKNREFVFQFKFVPRTAQEAEEILGIIRTLRFHAAPEYSVEGFNSRYFVPPSEFGIEFFIGSRRNTNIPRIAQCVLTNVDVNYAPSGQYSTYIDGMPTEISMQLTFTETVILTKEDVRTGY